jgi:hypothetical protein
MLAKSGNGCDPIHTRHSGPYPRNPQAIAFRKERCPDRKALRTSRDSPLEQSGFELPLPRAEFSTPPPSDEPADAVEEGEFEGDSSEEEVTAQIRMRGADPVGIGVVLMVRRLDSNF